MTTLEKLQANKIHDAKVINEILLIWQINKIAMYNKQSNKIEPVETIDAEITKTHLLCLINKHLWVSFIGLPSDVDITQASGTYFKKQLESINQIINKLP